jgi:hypothetical protein
MSSFSIPSREICLTKLRQLPFRQVAEVRITSGGNNEFRDVEVNPDNANGIKRRLEVNVRAAARDWSRFPNCRSQRNYRSEKL